MQQMAGSRVATDRLIQRSDGVQIYRKQNIGMCLGARRCLIAPWMACQTREADLRETKEIHVHRHHSQVTRRRDDDACRLRGTRGTRKEKTKSK
jgi:CO/xanthine dehydrogenase Mo-binding subunit